MSLVIPNLIISDNTNLNSMDKLSNKMEESKSGLRQNVKTRLDRLGVLYSGML